ncbi:hypothetical protein APY94_03700 [Thermococcus celericrescens]|uniref:Uncharacterized protein n=1 Tax=Thermococcus celericrescens TaxID=227598 RepID=A0A100XYI0_9EURY|nr:hypothetical protein [Thermococcus celericrescens]KUH33988.1 hypothetical protein APY94_03700 [Thermococcus celericrescens]
MNTTVPVRKLLERARSAGFDIVEAGRNGRLAVIDMFNEQTGLDFVYSIETVDRTLIIPDREGDGRDTGEIQHKGQNRRRGNSNTRRPL